MNFQHEILFEIDTDAPKTDIKIIINNDIKWTQTSESKLQKYKATFEHNYDNAQKNILQISWTGKEVKRKQLKRNINYHVTEST